MPISYNRLWKLLIDWTISKAAGIIPNTMIRLNRDEAATLAVLEKPCEMIHTDFSDMMKYIPEDNR